VRQILDAATETARPVIDKRRHALHVALPEEPLEVDGDPLRLAQVLSNLLTNAAKYTEPGGTIRVRVRREANQAEITVEDNGIGIAPDQLERVFEMFRQVPGPAHLTEGGLGIGLALARGLVEMHRGSLHAASDGIGRGARFVVRLPLLHETAAAKTPSPCHSDAAVTPRRILLVDDNADAADSLAMLLRLHGHEVQTAYDGETALRVAAEFRPEFALLDLGMPRMDGFELARRLRMQDGGARVTIVAVTGWGHDAERQHTRAAGFDYHLTKPVEFKALADILEQSTEGERAVPAV
jgi:CheY-like chemotaxis protein